MNEKLSLRTAPSEPSLAIALINRAHALSLRREFEQAQAVLEQALQLDDSLPMAHNNLGWVLQMLGDPDQAMASYRQAIRLNPEFDLPQRNLASLYHLCNQNDLALQAYHDLLRSFPDDRTICSEAFDLALKSGELTFAAECASKLARLDHGLDGSQPVAAGRMVTAAKLEHDVEQFTYLCERDVTTAWLRRALDAHCSALEQLKALNQATMPLSSFIDPEFQKTYNRLLHVRSSPRSHKAALSTSWNERDCEREYVERGNRFVVIDDFLDQHALEELRAFCLESTIWFENRYRYGRLGTFMRSGFHNPLLLQIAGELRQKLPRLIGEKYKLRQLWAFKYAQRQPVTPPHADFAAVNVNFWITSGEANNSADGGGLVVYDVEAPLSWSFEQYNDQGTKIRQYVDKVSKKATRIPYRCNRAVIFNSDLFHATDCFDFKTGYENRRINVTMLFGLREEEM